METTNEALDYVINLVRKRQTELSRAAIVAPNISYIEKMLAHYHIVEDILLGLSHDIGAMKPCSYCRGTGEKKLDPESTCPNCDGLGAE